MTTKKKTLKEAAVDILQASAKTDQEPMHKGPEVDNNDPSGAVVDLGGSTTEDPSGGPVGQKASAARSQMAPPKIGKNAAAEAMHAGPEDKGAASAASTEGEEDAKPPMATASGEAPLSTPGATEYVPTAEEIEVNHQERLASIRETMKTISVEEDIKALFAGSNLSEEFKTNAKTIFEAAVVARAVVVVEQIEQDMIAASEAAVNEIREELEGNVDKYLDHMVVEWMEQNQVAIESGLKAELVEEFIDGLRTLFIEHNMNIPEDSVPVVEQLTARVEELQAKLDETLNTNIVLSKSLAKGQKAKTLVTACEGLTATQAEKLKTLAEGVEFTTEGEYAGKVKVIRDQYFSTTVKVGGKAPAVLVEAADEATAVEGSSLTGSMAAYSETITRTVRK